MADLDGLPFKKEVINGRTVLVASAINSDEWLAKYKVGTEVMMTGRKPRNIHHHNLFFALARIVVRATDSIWADERVLLTELKDATGLTIRRLNALRDQTLPRSLQTLCTWLRERAMFTEVDEDRTRRALETAAETIETLYAKTLEIQIHGSIAFEAMDQDRFAEWFEKAVHVLATEVIGCEDQALIDEVLAMVSETDRQKWRSHQERRHHGNTDTDNGNEAV